MTTPASEQSSEYTYEEILGNNTEYPDTYFYALEGEPAYIKVYDASNGSILELLKILG